MKRPSLTEACSGNRVNTMFSWILDEDDWPGIDAGYNGLVPLVAQLVGVYTGACLAPVIARPGYGKAKTTWLTLAIYDAESPVRLLPVTDDSPSKLEVYE